MNGVITDSATKLEGVLTTQIRNLVNEVIDLVGPNNLREVFVAAQCCEAADADVGNSVQEWIGNARVDDIWEAGIARDDLEGVVGETGAEFVGPRRTRRPSPSAGDVLSAGMDFGAELRKQFVGVHAHNGVVAEEIGAAQGMMVADVVIDFAEGVLGTVLVGIVERNTLARRGISRKKGQQVGAERIHFTWPADSRCRVRDALGRVADRSSCRDIPGKRIADGIHLALITAKIEELVLDDVPAHGTTELLERERRF